MAEYELIIGYFKANPFAKEEASVTENFWIPFAVGSSIIVVNSFVLTNEISSSPKGEPWDDAFPDLFGEPKPITVLQDIKVGLLDLDALEIALEICFSLCPGGDKPC